MMNPLDFFKHINFSPNFWGIIGTITGVLSLALGWFKHRSETPKLVIDDLELQSDIANLLNFPESWQHVTSDDNSDISHRH